MSHYGKANISTEQPAARQDTRLSRENGDQERSSGPEETTREGAETFDPGALLRAGGRLSKDMRLRHSEEFRQVYAHGKRYDGRLMTAFVFPNSLSHHRIGITASRKAIGNAVERNRSKRLLREAFRLNGGVLKDLLAKYDWVLNARRSLLHVKLEAALEELRDIILRAASDETERTGAAER